MRVFITGSGTLATELVKQLHSTAERIVIYSRDEGKHAVLKETYPEGPPGPMRYRIGDIRDYERLVIAMQDCDTVIHTAAMKRIETCAAEVYECMKTNILGTYNVARACAATGIKKAMLISTDKACNAVSGGYGKSKAFAEELFIQSNLYSTCHYAACRYGNIKGSRGAVHNTWAKLAAEGKTINVTHPEMTRWFWDIVDAGKFVLSTVEHMKRGVVYVPKMPGYKMIDIAKEFTSDIKITGLRCGEKLHEEMISETEATYTYETADFYAIYPVSHEWERAPTVEGTKVPKDFVLRSCNGMVTDAVLKNGGCEDMDIADILEDMHG
jgi:UDP-N-acetylglucosamine 4,6-dehydratase/5-epimerase